MIRRTMLFGAAVIVLAGLAAGLSQATAPGKNGRIAFMQYELHDAPYTAHIMVTKSDGSGQRTITHAASKFVDDQPDWAPDASRIVFERYAPDSRSAIWTVRPDGRNPTRVSPRCPRCADDSFPAYSPDGRHIAFVRYRSTKPVSQLVMVADSNLRHARPVGSGFEPAWSPDGKQLVFVRKPGAFTAIYVENADGTGQKRITPWRLKGSKHPDWSPDGTRILFASGARSIAATCTRSTRTARDSGS